MADIAFRELLGTLPLDHRDFEAEGCTVEDMFVLFGVGMVGVAASEGVLPYRYHDEATRSPIFGWFHVPTEDEEARKVGVWRTGAALARTTTSAAAGAMVGARLVAAGDFLEHESLMPMEVFLDPMGGKLVPIGATVLVTRAQDENEQILVGSIVGDSNLIDQWRGLGVSTFSSVVSDIDAAGAIDPAVTAHLGTVWRITGRTSVPGVAPPAVSPPVTPPGGSTPPIFPPKSLAWVLGGTADGVGATGYGLCVGYRSLIKEATPDHYITDPGGSSVFVPATGLEYLPPDPRLLAGFASDVMAGPLSFGNGVYDKHAWADTSDGLKCVPLHLNTGAYWISPTADAESTSLADGPLNFEGIEGWGSEHGSLKARVHRTYDTTKGEGGTWVDWVRVPNFPPMAGSPEHPAGTNLEWMFQGGMTYQPIARWQKDLSRSISQWVPRGSRFESDIAAANDALEAEILRRAHDNPCTIKTLGFGAEGSASEWSAASRTGYADRLPGGLVAGGSVTLPAAWTLEDVDAALTLPTLATSHPVFWDVNCRVGRSLANRIDRVTGAPVDAWRESLDSSGDVTAAPFTVLGVAAPSRRWIFSGRVETTSVNRAVTTVTNAMSPYTVTATDYYLIVTTAGGAVTINLPASNAGARELEINHYLGAADATIAPAGGDVLSSGGTLKLGQSGRYQSNNNNGWVVCYNQIGQPASSVEFNQQQALQFCLENRTSDPGSPASGQVWLRTDL